MSDLADELVERVRQLLGENPSTESELRSLTGRAHELERTLAEDVDATETRLGELSRDPESSLAETAALLRRVETLKPELERAQALLENLDERARQLRTRWLLAQASDRPPAGKRRS